MTARVIRGPREDQLHQSVAELLDWVLLPPAFYTTFPAGWGVLSPSMAQRLKRCGLKAGMPDILLFYDGSCYGIELKAGKNAVSRDQTLTITKLSKAGVPVWICHSIDEVVDVLHVTGMPTRPITGDPRWLRSPKELPLAVTSARRADIIADAEGGANGEST